MMNENEVDMIWGLDREAATCCGFAQEVFVT